MKETRIPTRQNQSVEILIFPVDALGPAILIIVLGSALGSDYTNIGFVLALLWLKLSVKLKGKAKSYLKHFLWSKGFLPRVATRGIPNPFTKNYKR